VNTGQVISGAGHLGLITFALFGGAFQSEPLPFEVTEVMAISAEEFAALTQGESVPEAVANVDTPEPPQDGEAPALTSEADTPPERSEPEVAETSAPDEVPEPVAPAPQAEVSDEPPVMEIPQEDTALLVPEVSPRPQARPAPRVAPEPVARPERDVQVDDVERQEVAPSEEPAEVVEEESEATSPEEATTEIVTEAEENDVADAAPAQLVRPRSRPSRPQTTETAEPSAPETDNSAVNDALAEALGQSGTSSNDTPQGPPLTAGEKDALRVAVQNCWNVGSLSSEALRTTVVVGVEMAETGKPVTSSIKMLSSSGGSGAAAKQAFEAARRAIIRCGSGGFDLPVEKYDHWRDIEMTFNPERMRIK
jgi:hypothetical protein